ncbi:MAG: hypothetical protein ACTSVZ_08755, partial [Promethearchaeota archaeon]
PRWYNIWFTLGASKSLSNDQYLHDINSLIPKGGETYENLCYFLAESKGITINKAAQVVCYLIYHGLVFLETFSTHQLSNGTRIRKKRKSKSSIFRALIDDLQITEAVNNDSIIINQDYQSDQENSNNLVDLHFNIPEKYVEIVEFREKLVQLWLKKPKLYRTVEWRCNFCTKWKTSEKTIYNWINAYKNDGVEGLIPHYRNSGRKLRTLMNNSDIFEQARESYFKNGNTLKNAYKELEKLCQSAHITPPKESTFRSYLYRESNAADFARKRGKKYYKSNFTPSLASFQGAYIPMQILQFDNTRFDVFPVDSEEREWLPTPYMTAAIDCYSRMITGFDISFFPSSGRSVLEVLIQSILSKQKYCSYYNTQSSWDIQGFPVMILVDNGMDYRSKILKRICMKYDIILEFAPIRTPRYKAFIEQWFNILRNALKDEKVGGYRPLLKERIENPSLKPETEAILTLQEIEEWAHKWVLDDYHFSNPYDDHVPAPHLRWDAYQAGQTKFILPLPREPPINKSEVDLLHLSKFHRISRTLGYHGVVWEYLVYNNKQLARIYNKQGKGDVSVLINQRDIRSVWVVIPREPKPIKVGLGSGWAQAIAKIHGNRPINASAWKTDIKWIKKKLKSKISPHLYQKEMSRLQRENLLNNAKRKTKSVRKAQEKGLETNEKAEVFGIEQESKNGNKEMQNSELKLKKKKIRKEIDWNNLPELLTDDFYAGDL